MEEQEEHKKEDIEEAPLELLTCGALTVAGNPPSLSLKPSLMSARLVMLPPWVPFKRLDDGLQLYLAGCQALLQLVLLLLQPAQVGFRPAQLLFLAQQIRLL
ncbi:hypothetical protein EYF80_028036 [Liparis tanakae]|uniref:Uncharacterized protein n=1 Tax=Liparis tanakae TaxID=230148 RepID=A0A4Z2H741_9TELE|nr:hypothetical protein EYF80_028036 [Liparis tanakae]